MSTTEPIIPRRQPDRGDGRRGRRRWLRAAAAVIVVLGVLVAVSFTVQLNEYALMPGSACVVNTLTTRAYSAACGGVPLVSVPPGKGHPSRGAILLTDVSLSQVSLATLIPDHLRSDTQVVSAQALLGTTPPSELGAQDRLAMTNSTLAARVAALRRLGYPVTIKADGSLVNEVEPKSPAYGRLHIGDIITAIDGRATPSAQDLVTATRGHSPSQLVHLTVQAMGSSQTRAVAITLGSHQEKGKEVAYIGVTLEQHYSDAFPIQININSANIGGPSAGLAFTLAIIQELTPGDITGGQRIAATGTIAPDGTVGEIGGVAQKTAAVQAAGGSVFLVPQANYAEAKAHAGQHLKVIAVNSLDQALAALGTVGAEVGSLPAPPPRDGG